jgi:beta-lactamase regulating signal transducer with metallopeptidase domain
MDLSLLLKLTVALGLGLGAAAVARRTRASVRHVILTSTFAALIAVPMAAALLPDLRVAVQPPVLTFTQLIPDVHVREQVSRIAETTSAPFVASGATLPRAGTLAYAIWAIGMLFLVGTLALALLRLRALRRTALPWAEGQAALERVADRFRLPATVDVLRHEAVGAPVTWGVFRPVVLMPLEADTWDEQQLTQAFLHELEHVYRKDWIIQVVARTLCAVYWFHPLVWVAWRQLCLESERACDDAVVAHVEGAAYAQQLVTLAQRVSVARAVPMLSMASRSDLSVRVKALLDATLDRGRVGRRVQAGALTIAAIIAGTLAALRAESAAPVARSADIDLATVVEAFTDRLEAQAEHLQDSVVDSLRGRPSGSRGRRALVEALIESAGDGNIKDVTTLLDSGMDVNTVLEGDGTALIAAARRGGFPMVKLLVDRGADVNLAVRGDGNPLIMAAAAGAEDVVRYLLDRGADVEAIVPGDENPLITASARGHLPVVKLLVSRGANVNSGLWLESNGGYGGQRGPQREWRSPLSMATQGGHRAVVDFLRANGAAN